MTDSSAVLASSGDARSAARNAAVLVVASIVSKGILFAWQLVLPRLIDQAAYGIYGTIGGMLVVAAAIPEFGMGIIALRDVAQNRALAGKMLSATLVTQPFLGLFAYGGLILAGFMLGYEDTLRSLLPLAGLTLFIDVLGTMVHNQLLARDQMVIPSIIGVAHMVVLIVLVGAAVLGGLGLTGLYWAAIVASSFRAIVYWIALIRAGVHTEWPLDVMVVGRLLKNGAPLAANAFMVFMYQHIDKIVMTAMIGEENTALLVAAFIIVTGMVELLNITVLVAVLPMMSRQHGAGEYEAFHFLVEKISFLTLVLAVPVAVMISVLASTLVSVLFAPEYTTTTDVLQILIWYGVLSMLTNVFGQALMIQNRQVRILAARIGGLIVNVALLVWLLPRLGVSGAAAGSVVAEVLVASVLARLWDEDGQHIRRVLPRLARLFAAGLAMSVVMILVRDAGLTASGNVRVFSPLLAIFSGMMVYGVAVWRLAVIAPDDRGFIRQVLISMPGGALFARVWKQS